MRILISVIIPADAHEPAMAGSQRTGKVPLRIAIRRGALCRVRYRPRQSVALLGSEMRPALGTEAATWSIT